ncbi:hypothetical protein [Amycolatopsis sp. cmx-4-68]|uniref:hypothetical protein n=1 Tax=Amycolatopsis sp. cmx-4-68 TaxID=2790938 RepID=UPI003979472E
MREGRAWRGLAVAYAVVSAGQAYLAATTGVTWAAALATVFLACAIGCGVAAWRPRGDR